MRRYCNSDATYLIPFRPMSAVKEQREAGVFSTLRKKVCPDFHYGRSNQNLRKLIN